jgi:YcxB-like protein
MKVEFAYTVEDYLEWSRAKDPDRRRKRADRSPARSDRVARAITRKAVLILILFALSVMLIFTSSIYLAWQKDRTWLVPPVFLVVFLFPIARALIRRYTRWGLRKTFADNERSTDPVIFEIDQAGFHLLSPTWQCHVEWRAVTRFFATTSLFLVFDDTPNAFIVPKRAFANPEAQEDFCQFIREQMEKAKSAKPA